MLECEVKTMPGVVVVWRRGGEGGRTLAVGKLLVRRDVKGTKSQHTWLLNSDFLFSASVVRHITRGVGSV